MMVFSTLLVLTEILLVGLGTVLAAGTGDCGPPSYGKAHSTKSFDVPFQSLVTFGDSFTDVGTISQASGGLAPPSSIAWKGRWADGRNWADKLALYFGFPEMEANKNGFAWGGATSTEFFAGYGMFPVPSVAMQIKMYLQAAEDGKAKSDTLYAVVIGHNDYYYYVQTNVTGADDAALPTEEDYDSINSMVTSFVMQQVQTLYDSGARNILVGNVINMAKSPEVASREPNVAEAYNYMIPRHNQMLFELLEEFETANSDATLYPFDFFGAIECTETEKDFWGFVDVDNACYPDLLNLTNACDDIFAYKWWDYLHPGTHSHQILAGYAIDSIFGKEIGTDDPTSGAMAKLLRGILVMAVTAAVAILAF